MGGIRSSPWSQLPSSPDCDLCMQQLCTCAGGAGGEGMQGGVGLPGARITIVSSPAAYQPSSPSMHPAPAQTLYFATFVLLVDPLWQNLKNRINHQLHECRCSQIKLHTDVISKPPLKGARQHFHIRPVHDHKINEGYPKCH